MISVRARHAHVVVDLDGVGLALAREAFGVLRDHHLRAELLRLGVGSSSQLARGTGRLQLEDRELPWFPNRHLGSSTRGTGLYPGAEVRRPGDDREGRQTASSCDRKPYAIEIDDDVRVLARTVIIATGAAYRKPPIENLPQFEGAGVYYGATFMEAQLCRGEEVVVVGGGNSAGQAAVFLAQSAKRVHMLVRSSGLAESMSRYLIRRIEQNPAIVLRTNTEIVALEGGNHLERRALARRSDAATPRPTT